MQVGLSTLHPHHPVDHPSVAHTHTATSFAKVTHGGPHTQALILLSNLEVFALVQLLAPFFPELAEEHYKATPFVVGGEHSAASAVAAASFASFRC